MGEPIEVKEWNRTSFPTSENCPPYARVFSYEEPKRDLINWKCTVISPLYISGLNLTILWFCYFSGLHVALWRQSEDRAIYHIHNISVSIWTGDANIMGSNSNYYIYLLLHVYTGALAILLFIGLQKRRRLQNQRRWL